MENLRDTEAAPLSCDVEVLDGVATITVAGELDLSNVEELRTQVDAVLASSPRSAVFDLSGLEFVDSSGLGLLIDAAQRAGQVTVRRPSRPVRRLIEISGLTEILPMEE